MTLLKIIIAATALTLAGCAGIKTVPFSAHRFHVDPRTGNVHNTDSTLRFTFCTDVPDPEQLLIDSEVATARYHGLHRYLSGICHRLHVRCDSILFYAPQHDIMLVRISETVPWKPGSQTINMTEENPYCSWVRHDDVEPWQRKPTEMYTNIILNRHKKHILVVNRFTYKKQDVALIYIIQSPTKQFMKIGLPPWTETWADVTDPASLEPIANWIDGHRRIAIENYRLGLHNF